MATGILTVNQRGISAFDCATADITDCKISSAGIPSCDIKNGTIIRYEGVGGTNVTDRGSASLGVGAVIANAWTIFRADLNPVPVFVFDLNTNDFSVGDMVTLDIAGVVVRGPLIAGSGVVSNIISGASFHIELTEAEYNRVRVLRAVQSNRRLQRRTTTVYFFRNSDFTVIAGDGTVTFDPNIAVPDITGLDTTRSFNISTRSRPRNNEIRFTAQSGGAPIRAGDSFGSFVQDFVLGTNQRGAFENIGMTQVLFYVNKDNWARIETVSSGLAFSAPVVQVRAVPIEFKGVYSRSMVILTGTTAKSVADSFAEQTFLSEVTVETARNFDAIVQVPSTASNAGSELICSQTATQPAAAVGPNISGLISSGPLTVGGTLNFSGGFLAGNNFSVRNYDAFLTGISSFLSTLGTNSEFILYGNGTNFGRMTFNSQFPIGNRTFLRFRCTAFEGMILQNMQIYKDGPGKSVREAFA